MSPASHTHHPRPVVSAPNGPIYARSVISASHDTNRSRAVVSAPDGNRTTRADAAGPINAASADEGTGLRRDVCEQAYKETESDQDVLHDRPSARCWMVTSVVLCRIMAVATVAHCRKIFDYLNQRLGSRNRLQWPLERRCYGAAIADTHTLYAFGTPKGLVHVEQSSRQLSPFQTDSSKIWNVRSLEAYELLEQPRRTCRR